ncbi:MAG: pyridoxamine 5'-phosphate oxidase family protein [Desulfobacterales bacterium]|nr:pyridoxamine 5'-phosphate oxidase family protein [Desulfobacterales bacterium]
MNMKEYFERTPGRGVLSTADSNGKVDAAIYSTPHILTDGTVAFIMRDRLSHHNIRENPYASYLFIEDTQRSVGLRLFLKRFKEETDAALIKSLMRRHLSPEEDQALGQTFLVSFTIEKILPLIGSDPSKIPVC